MVGVDPTTIYSRQLSYEMQRWHHTSCLRPILTSLTYLNSMSNVLYILRTNFPIFPGSNVDGIIQYLPCVRGTRAKTLLPLENGPECSFVSLSCILNFLFTSVWIVRKIDHKSKEINTWQTKIRQNETTIKHNTW
jgi:hypothetical protein